MSAQILTPPPSKGSAGSLLRSLFQQAGWSPNSFADLLYTKLAAAGLLDKDSGGPDENTIKDWLTDRSLPVKYRQVIYDVIIEASNSPEVSQAWLKALNDAWTSQGINKKKQAATLKALQTRIKQDARLNSLPALFETDFALPLSDDTYVELRIAPASPIAASPHTLETRLTLGERLRQRAERRFTSRRLPKDVLDIPGQKSSLILGAPGTGKSSLLKRLALDIANKGWERAQLPIFLEARGFAEALQRDVHLTLINYAVEQLAGPDLDPTLVHSVLFNYKTQGYKSPIILLDGLDEIASNSDAVRTLYSQLRELSMYLPWIATSRPAGLMESVNEERRFEMTELNQEAISNLIKGWCKATETAETAISPKTLELELERVPSIREMAANPFLLTALCFLKSTDPGSDLPASRIAVYETLIDRIAYQAQHRLRNPDILSNNARADLIKFARFLYEQPNGAVQIFSHKHWHAFKHSKHYGGATDFHHHILPARLLTAWSAIDAQYHFIHLTLQEHLVAQAMLEGTVEEALDRRFMSAWRSVFRFYGALLWQRGRQDEFRRLTKTLYNNRDILGLSLIALAEIFADAGIRDTVEWIENDLREELFEAFETTHENVRNGLIDALALLDPDWLVDCTNEELDDLWQDIEDHVTNQAEEDDYPGRSFVVFGRDYDSPYYKFSQSRTVAGFNAMEEAFWGSQQSKALAAAYAFADRASPEDRRKIVCAGEKAVIFDDTAIRVFAFAEAQPHSDFLPFLRRVVQHFSHTEDGPYEDAMMIIAVIGGEQAQHIFLEQLKQKLHQTKGNHERFRACCRTVLRLESAEAAWVFKKISEDPLAIEFREQLNWFLFESFPDKDEIILNALRNPVEVERALTAITRAATYGRPPNQRVLKAVQKIDDKTFYELVQEIAHLEGACLDYGGKPLLCERLLSVGTELYNKLTSNGKISDSECSAEHKMSLILIFDTLGRAAWQPAQPLVERILSEQVADQQIMSSTTRLAGNIFANSKHPQITAQLEEWLYNDDESLAFEAALSLGQIDIERLFMRQSSSHGRLVLETIAADKDLLIFDRFWTDKSGQVKPWKTVPAKILHVFGEDRPQASHIFAHEMSRWEFVSTIYDEPDECIAFLIFEPLDEFGRDQIEQINRLASSRGTDVVFQFHSDYSEHEAQERARIIGQALSIRFSTSVV